MVATQQVVMRVFRVVASVEGEVIPIGLINFEQLIAQYAALATRDRRLAIREVAHVFEPRNDVATRALVLHKLRDPNTSLSWVADDGHITESMASHDGLGTLADSSCVVFESTRNAFAIVRGNGSAPTANRIADWLNHLKPLADHPKAKFEAVPLMARADLSPVRDAHGARKLEIAMPVEDLDDLGLSLRADAKRASEIAPGAEVRISLSYGNRRPDSGGGGALLGLIQRVASNLSGVTSATAGVYREVEGKKKGTTRLEPETIDLLQHNLARRLNVRTVEGRPSISATLVAMDGTIRDMQAQITQAWERGSDDTGAAEGMD